MKDKVYFGRIISTAESKPAIVRGKEFATRAEALAYAAGANDGVAEADPDNDDLIAMVQDYPADDE